MTLLFNEKSIDLIHKICNDHGTSRAGSNMKRMSYFGLYKQSEPDTVKTIAGGKRSIILGYIDNPRRAPLKPLLETN